MIKLIKTFHFFDLTLCAFLPLTWHCVLPVEADCGWGCGLHVPPDGQRKTGGANTQTYTSRLVPLQEKQRALHHKQGELEIGVSWGCPFSILTTSSLCRLNEMIFFSPQSLCQVIDASVNMGSRVLETQLDSLLVALHQQVRMSVTPTSTSTLQLRL